jgi:hypothetical protein
MLYVPSVPAPRPEFLRSGQRLIIRTQVQCRKPRQLDRQCRHNALERRVDKLRESAARCEAPKLR